MTFRFCVVLVLFGVVATQQARAASSNIVEVVGFCANHDEITRGRGFLVGDGRMVVTAWHNLAGAQSVLIREASGVTFPATAIAAQDVDADLAIVSVAVPPIPGLSALRPDALPIPHDVLLVDCGLVTGTNSEQVTPLNLMTSVKAVTDVMEFGEIIALNDTLPFENSGCPVYTLRGGFAGVVVTRRIQNLPISFVVPAQRVVSLLEVASQGGSYQMPTLTDVAWHYQTGMGLLWLEKYKEAALEFQSAVKIDPSYFRAQFQACNALDQSDQTKLAESYCKSATELEPKSTDAHNNYGVVLSKLGKQQLALAEFKIAATLSDSALPLFDEGVVLSELGRNAEAEQVLMASLKRDPYYIPALITLSAILNELSKNHESFLVISRAASLSPQNSDVFNQVGMAFSALKLNERAVEAHEYAVLLNPQNAIARYNLAIELVWVGRKTDATVQRKILLNLDPALVKDLDTYL